MEEDRKGRGKEKSLNIIAKQWKWIWTKWYSWDIVKMTKVVKLTDVGSKVADAEIEKSDVRHF